MEITSIEIKQENTLHKVYKPLTVAEVRAMLLQWPDDTKVYVDFDRDGDTEVQARHVEPINAWGCEGVKIS